jgi:hypothetical protein
MINLLAGFRMTLLQADSATLLDESEEKEATLLDESQENEGTSRGQTSPKL